MKGNTVQHVLMASKPQDCGKPAGRSFVWVNMFSCVLMSLLQPNLSISIHFRVSGTSLYPQQPLLPALQANQVAPLRMSTAVSTKAEKILLIQTEWRLCCSTVNTKLKLRGSQQHSAPCCDVSVHHSGKYTRRKSVFMPHSDKTMRKTQQKLHEGTNINMWQKTTMGQTRQRMMQKENLSLVYLSW